MTRNLKVLILYAQYGQGHLQVSRALENHFSETANVVLEDLFASAHPFIEGFTRFIYEQSFTGASFLYGWSYYLTQNMGHDTPLSKWFHSFGIHKLREIVKNVQPDLVINTFPMLAMPELKERTGTNIPVFTVLTDFALHGRWLHSKINKYYVATPDLQSKMINQGISADKIKVTGIPIRKDFEQPVNRDDCYKAFHLDPNRKTVLIMAGAHINSIYLKKLCRLLAQEQSLQTVLVCGYHKRLQKEMKDCFSGESNIRIFGYVENIHQLMGIASCIATKSGGVTLSEALRASLPIFLFRPVPGQEKENARYLAKNGAAKIFSGIEELATEITNLLLPMGEKRLKEMKRAVMKMQRKNAASAIVADMIQETDKIKTVSGGQIRFL